MAIKSLHQQYLASEHNNSKYKNEINLLRLLKHKNVIRLYDTFVSKNYNLIVIELCGGGDLLTYVRMRRKLAEPVAKAVFKQVNPIINHFRYLMALVAVILKESHIGI